MRFAIRSTVLVSCFTAALFGSIDGTVVNRTTGKPEAGVSITLVKPGQNGMQTLGTTVSGTDGRFLFEKDQPGGGPQLLQASFKNVNYNKLMTPNIPTSNVELDVYEASKSPAVAQVAQRMMVLEPSATRLAVSETVVVNNPSTTTYNNDALGSLRFYLPPAANGQVRINAQGPQGMPLPRPAEKTDQHDIYQVNFPVKPGQTQFELSYTLPAANPLTFAGRVVNVKGMPAGPLRLVVPSGVTLAGDDIQSLGTEPKTQAAIYNVNSADKFSFTITGIGSLHTGEEQTPAATDNSESPQVTQGPPQIYRHLGWLAALALSILAIGLVVLFRNSPVRSPYGN